MESKSTKRHCVPRSPSVFPSGERWRVSPCLSASASISSWGALRFPHHRLPSSHFLLSTAASPDHFTLLRERQPQPTLPKISLAEFERPGAIPISGRCRSPGLLRLPMLRSLESVPTPTKMPTVSPNISTCNLISVSGSSRKRSRPSSGSSSTNSPPPRVSPLPSPLRGRSVPSSELARLRRKKISDRTRIIESLMPWQRKMDTGTMLGEAFRYVRFLEAQVAALFMMPISAEFSAAPVSSGRGGALGGLEQLNRQQMLQVAVNSPQVQEKLYERGICVFSAEQVAAFQRSGQDMPSSASAASNATR